MSLNNTTVEEEVDNRDDDGRCLVSVAQVIRIPLHEDQEVHVAEDRQEQDQLWEELVKHHLPILEVPRIYAFLNDAE